METNLEYPKWLLPLCVVGAILALIGVVGVVVHPTLYALGAGLIGLGLLYICQCKGEQICDRRARARALSDAGEGSADDE